MSKNTTFVLWALIAAVPGFAQLSPVAEAAVHAENQYQVIPNVTYLTAGGVDFRHPPTLDRTAPRPACARNNRRRLLTVFYIPQQKAPI